jgi:hypothetical protein
MGSVACMAVWCTVNAIVRAVQCGSGGRAGQGSAVVSPSDAAMSSLEPSFKRACCCCSCSADLLELAKLKQRDEVK